MFKFIGWPANTMVTEIRQDTHRMIANRRLAVIVFVAAAIAAPHLVQAQSIEEIVVTARKRAESLQDAPLAISAFTEEEIQASGIKDLEDIAVQSPGFVFNSDLSSLRPGRLYTDMRFRGVEGSETGALFVDGIYVLQGAQTMSLVDIERVEVIKGPQSAIFGRNTFAGAINYVTRDPSMDEFQGRISLDSAQYQQSEVKASVEGPLIQDKLSARVGARFYNKGSMYTASDGGRLGEQSSDSLSLTVMATPTDSLTFRARAFYQEDDDGPAATAFLKFTGDDVGNDTCTGTSYRGYNDDGDFVDLFPQNFRCGGIPSPGEAGAPSVDSNTSLTPQHPSFDSNPNFLIDNLFTEQFITGVPPVDGMGINRRMVRLSLSAEYAFENGMEASATVAYNEVKASALYDFDQTEIESFWVSNPQKGDDTSVELRLESATDGRLRWLGGFNYYEQEYITDTGSGDVVHVCGNFAGIPNGEFCTRPGFFRAGFSGNDQIEVASVFAFVSYDITDSLTVDLEGRYQVDERTASFDEAAEEYRDFVPRVSITYSVNDDVNLYGVATQGLKPGVINDTFTQCSDVPLTQPFISPFTGQPSFSTECEQWVEQLGGDIKARTDEQKLNSFELGMKAYWMNRRLMTNVSVYYQEWINQPFGSGAQIVRDPDRDGIPEEVPEFTGASEEGESEYMGVEVEAAFQIMDRWTANLNLSYNDNELVEFFIRSSNTNLSSRLGTTNLRGTRTSRFPEWSGSASTTYERTLNEKWDLFARGDIVYTGEATTGEGGLSKLDAYMLVNARIGIQNEDFSIDVYVKNLFDEDKWRAGTDFADFSVVSNTGFNFTNGGILLVPQDKRTFGIRASYSF